MLALSTKPFIVTGDYSVTASMVDQINEKGVILGVTMDPSDVKTLHRRSGWHEAAGSVTRTTWS